MYTLTRPALWNFWNSRASCQCSPVLWTILLAALAYLRYVCLSMITSLRALFFHYILYIIIHVLVYSRTTWIILKLIPRNILNIPTRIILRTISFNRNSQTLTDYRLRNIHLYHQLQTCFIQAIRYNWTCFVLHYRHEDFIRNISEQVL
jgi:hypothetical protein